MIQNPNAWSFTDAGAAAQGVTGATIHVGTVSGGPYPQSFAVPASVITADLASGNFSGPLSDLTPTWNLAPGSYFAVCTLTTAAGAGPNSAEFAFQQVGLPPAPSAFSLS